MLSVSQLQVVLYIFYNKILKETIFRFVMMFDRKKSVQRRSAISFSFSQKILFHHVVFFLLYNFEDFDHIQMRDASKRN